jgi:hypothetical protein
MRRWLSSVLVVIIAAMAIWLGVHLRRARLKRERAAAYQQALLSYTSAIPLDSTRERVESELRRRGAPYELGPAFDGMNAYSDLVRIGTEPAPWYCSENNVYIKFAFDAAKPSLDSPSESESDILRSIEVTPWLTGCL